tara:strand:+ start:21708 stop:22142 length:435 start_codon:yes stop_codon:yes gene_type:complete
MALIVENPIATEDMVVYDATFFEEIYINPGQNVIVEEDMGDVIVNTQGDDVTIYFDNIDHEIRFTNLHALIAEGSVSLSIGDVVYDSTNVDILFTETAAGQEGDIVGAHGGSGNVDNVGTGSNYQLAATLTNYEFDLTDDNVIL